LLLGQLNGDALRFASVRPENYPHLGYGPAGEDARGPNTSARVLAQAITKGCPMTEPPNGRYRSPLCNDGFVSDLANTFQREVFVKLNSSADELSPKITPDGQYFFWASTRSAIDRPKTNPWTLQTLSRAYQSPGNGLGDIYHVSVSALKLER
jgi:WD40-like Beta Propeller Repeat